MCKKFATFRLAPFGFAQYILNVDLGKVKSSYGLNNAYKRKTSHNKITILYLFIYLFTGYND